MDTTIIFLIVFAVGFVGFVTGGVAGVVIGYTLCLGYRQTVTHPTATPTTAPCKKCSGEKEIDYLFCPYCGTVDLFAKENRLRQLSAPETILWKELD